MKLDELFRIAQGLLPLLERVLILGGTVLGLAVLCLFVFQRKLIYCPARYQASPRILLRPYLEQGSASIFEFEVRGTKQNAYYLKGGNTDPQADYFIYFGGNASLALDWLDIAEALLPCCAGTLLIEYPGYGVNEGQPSRKLIRATARAAFLELARKEQVDPMNLSPRLSLVGVSLGCAVALDFAREFPVRKIILLAPFTSMSDMARLSVGSLLSHLLLDRFDNRDALTALRVRQPPPTVYLFHGDSDAVVPVAMGRKLGEEFSDIVRYREIPGVDHFNIVDTCFSELKKILCTSESGSTCSPVQKD